MRETDFTERRTGQLVPTIDGQKAFVPDLLPPKDQAFSEEVVQILAEANLALGRLDGLGRRLTNPHLLIQPFLRREAVLSSKIEGTQASLSDLYLFEADMSEPQSKSDVQEVVQYVDALTAALKQVQTIPPSLRLIRDTHERLMSGVRGEDRRPGEFRRDQNWIGLRKCPIKDATYIPPPPSEVLRLLDNFEKYINAADRFPLVSLALMHYQFEAIHPFIDGNGRIGRLLIILLLCTNGILSQPLLYLSAYFEQNRERYYELLLLVSKDGVWNEWIHFFLTGVRDQAVDAVARINRLDDLRIKYHELVKAERSAAHIKLIDHLFGRPILTTVNATDVLGYTYIGAQNVLQNLVRAGIIREVRVGGRKYYVCQDIFNIIEAT